MRTGTSSDKEQVMGSKATPDSSAVTSLSRSQLPLDSCSAAAGNWEHSVLTPVASEQLPGLEKKQHHPLSARQTSRFSTSVLILQWPKPCGCSKPHNSPELTSPPKVSVSALTQDHRVTVNHFWLALRASCACPWLPVAHLVGIYGACHPRTPSITFHQETSQVSREFCSLNLLLNGHPQHPGLNKVNN